MIIRLPKGEWIIHYDQQLGREGGFGIVYAGEQNGFPPLAIKKLKLTAKTTANREMRMAEKLSSENLHFIIPVFDYGQDAESDNYFIVMARADKNLSDELKMHRTFTAIDSARIIIQIVNGLEEINEIVHRDLKPENILYHNQIWKLSDFGIAKFVEESTSLNTLKEFMTYAYAAPEQWKGESVSSATDLYAVGCILYELLTGKPPYPGPDATSYQEQHVNGAIPDLDCDDAILRSLGSMLLRKSPQSRPSRHRILELLNKIANGRDAKPLSDGLGKIASIGAREAARIAEQERQDLLLHQEKQRRLRLAADAFNIIQKLREKLFKEISDLAPVAKIEEGERVILGTAILYFDIDPHIIFLENPFSEVGWDVICGAQIIVTQSSPKKYTRSSSLWYTNQGIGESYRWIEVSYWDTKGEYEDATPFCFNDPTRAVEAHRTSFRRFSIATRPRPIDDEAAEEFIDRWTNILSRAYDGKLAYPSHLPIDF